jgi:hypothetical protein
MKFLMLLLSLCSLGFGKEYYAKVEPYEIRDISSNVSGVVVYADEALVGKTLTSLAYVKIDSEIDEKELKSTKLKLLSIKNIVEINEAIITNLDDSLVKKRENYKKIETLKFKSLVEKDKEFYELISSENLYLNTRKEIQNLKNQIIDLEFRISLLQKSIADKNLSAKNFILYEMLVRPGKVVNIGTPLAKIADISKAKLTIYIDEQDLQNIQNLNVYIDGEKTSYKISRVLKIADGKNISKYMAQIIIKSPKIFSKLVKVDLKDK